MDPPGRCPVLKVHRGADRSPCRTGREEKRAPTGTLGPHLPSRCRWRRVSFLFHSPCWAGCRQGSPHQPEDRRRNRSQLLLLLTDRGEDEGNISSLLWNISGRKCGNHFTTVSSVAIKIRFTHMEQKHNNTMALQSQRVNIGIFYAEDNLFPCDNSTV